MKLYMQKPTKMDIGCNFSALWYNICKIRIKKTLTVKGALMQTIHSDRDVLSATKTDRLELIPIAVAEIRDELDLDVSLYRIDFHGIDFYAVASENRSNREDAALAFLGKDRTVAERCYKMIVKGSVPPSTLREVVFDLLP